MLRQITLHGALADKFGSKPIELDVDTPLLLFSGLDCVLPKFKQAFQENASYQIAKVNHKNKSISYIDEQTFGMSLGNATDIHIIPEVEGGGFAIAAAILATETGVAYYALGTVISIALSAVMSSVAQMFCSTTSTSDASVTAADRPSYIFNKAINVTSPGNVVPLVYGECKTGSVVISVGVTTEQL